jgi:hypothetical protein
LALVLVSVLVSELVLVLKSFFFLTVGDYRFWNLFFVFNSGSIWV